MLYVFVDIKIDTAHFVETLRFNFKVGARLALVSTVQFVAALQVRRFSMVLELGLLLVVGQRRVVWGGGSGRTKSSRA